MATKIQNNLFDSRVNYDRGRNVIFFATWQLVKVLFFLSGVPWPSAFKVSILRLFGAKMGRGVVLKPRVNIHLPWKLDIGNYVWIGEEVFILNLEHVRIGDHVCISQRAFLCTGNHDYKKIDMPYRNRAIVVGDGAWVCAQVFIGPGVEIGNEAVVAAGSIVTSSLPAAMVCSGNPCQSIKPRWDN